MRGAIAIGSNSTRMLTARKRQGALEDIYRGREETRLFLGLDAQGNILPERMESTAQAVLRLYAQARARGADSVRLFATSAMRDAGNGDALARRIRDLCGLELQVISGEEEARLAFRAVAGMERRLVMDIGGGSTELTLGEGGLVQWAGSAQLGASRLLKTGEIHSEADAERCMALAREALWPFAERLKAFAPAPAMIGMGGSCTTAAAILLGWEAHGEELEGRIVTLGDARAMLAQLAPMPLEERCRVPGLPRSRVQHFPHGLCILIAALELCGQESISVSICTNLDGYLLSLPDEADGQADAP